MDDLCIMSKVSWSIALQVVHSASLSSIDDHIHDKYVFVKK